MLRVRFYWITCPNIHFLFPSPWSKSNFYANALVRTFLFLIGSRILLLEQEDLESLLQTVQNSSRAEVAYLILMGSDQQGIIFFFLPGLPRTGKIHQNQSKPLAHFLNPGKEIEVECPCLVPRVTHTSHSKVNWPTHCYCLGKNSVIDHYSFIWGRLVF